MWSKLVECRAGNFGVISAIALLPIMLSCGVAVDVTNLLRLKSNLQNANDAAAFMAARVFDQTGALPRDADIQKKIEENLGRGIGGLNAHMEGRNLVLTSELQADLIFGSILPASSRQVSVLSAVNVQGGRQLHVVLVLDSTYSMIVDDKIGALKKAATEFVKTLLDMNKANRTAVKIGIVPFAQYVNVGLDNRYAKWMSVPPDTERPYHKCWMRRGKLLSQRDCQERTWYRDGVPQHDRQCKNTYAPDEEVCGDYVERHTWHGCVGSRRAPLTLKDEQPDKPFPGLLDVDCPSPITPLTSNRGALQSEISKMKPDGDTYIADGVMWGLRVLSEIEPFTEAANATSGAGEVEKVMILMTDGDNVRAPSLPNSSAHNDTDTKKADDYTRQACAEVKNAEVSLYTISFGREVSANGKALMETCADPEQFYDATDVDKISEAFESIAASIADIRLTQ